MKQKITYLIFITIALVVGITSCTERIDIELEEDYIKLAVEGYITPETGNRYIRLTETSGYFSNTAAPAVSNAIVHVDNGIESYTLQEDAVESGTYIFPEEFIGEPETNYQLSIELSEEIGGQTSYKAATYMPRRFDDIDSITVEFDPYFEFWMVNIYAMEPPGKDFYMFNGLVNDILITDTISLVTITDDELIDGNYLNGVTVMGFYEEELKPGDKFTLILSTITEDYYNYIIDLQTEISMNIPIFSGPPANVSTNVDNGAVGYFAAYPSTYSSTIVKSP